MAIQVLTQRDLQTLSTLPVPQLDKESIENVRRIAAAAYEFWINCLNNEVSLPSAGLTSKCGRCPNTHRYDPNAALNRVLMVAGLIYIESAREFFLRASIREISGWDFPGCSVQELDDLRRGTGSTVVE